MKTKLTIDDFKGMLVRALEMIREREDEFSRLDAIIGDGEPPAFDSNGNGTTSTGVGIAVVLRRRRNQNEPC